MHKFVKSKWIAEGGSIFTEHKFKVKLDFAGGHMLQRGAIAFNVGDEIAKHIVQLHNDDIEQRACVEAIAARF